MLKISSTDVRNILSMVPDLLREQQSKIASLEETVSRYERKERVEKIANAMEAKNLNSELSHEEKIRSLMNADDRYLDVTEEAVNMQPKQIALGTLDKQAGNSINAFTAFVEELID